VDTKFASALTSNAEIRDMVLSRMAIKQIAQPQDIAGIALLLASDQGRYFTGECVVVDGGWTIG
jgi:NAD(P)-dependent dehydrogenase (short-subunit alcohol dehydrogenase family)